MKHSFKALSLLGIIAFSLVAPKLASACTIYDTNYKSRGSVQNNMVINSAWKIVGNISGNYISNSSGQIVGSLIGESIVTTKGAITGHAVKPNLFNDAYQLIGNGADCSNSELAAAKLLLF